MSVNSQAAVLPDAQQPVEIRQVEIPDPPPGHVLVEMEACGICHSDLFIAGLPKLRLTPLTLGHEAIGVVRVAGEGVTDFAPGDRVGITFLASTCGQCEYCRSGRERFCPEQKNTGFTVHGVLSQYALASAQQLVRVPEDIPAHEAAPLCCAGWTAYGALREAGLEPGETLAIFGFGGLGHLALRYALLRHLRVVVADVWDAKLEAAKAAGAEAAVRAEDGGRKLQKQMGGADAAIVLTASPAAIEQAFRSVKRQGSVILVGLSTHAFTLPVTDAVLKGIRVQGSFLGTKDDLEQVFRLASDKSVTPHAEQHTLSETPELLRRLANHEVQGRAVVVF